VARIKAVISADPDALADVEALVRGGQYATVSEFVREAIAANLVRVRQARLAEQVARYCASGAKQQDDDDTDDLIASQALPRPEDA
jgi:Arc/MetJ-type ribon-helix-helix transcriptional regulator